MEATVRKNQGLICAYLVDGHGGGRALSWEDVKAWKPADGLLWVNLNYSEKHAKQWVAHEAQLQSVIVQALLIRGSRPRCVFLDEGLLMILRGVNHTASAAAEDLLSTRIWMEKNRIITTQQYRLASLGDVQKDIEAGHGPKTVGDILMFIIHYTVNATGVVIDSLIDRTDKMEGKIVKSSNMTHQTHLSNIRREVIGLHRYLSPQRDAMARLIARPSRLLSRNNMLEIKEDMNRVVRYTEDLHALHDRALVAHQEITNRLADLTNKRMYVLSLVAVIFLPLSFVTSLLGINVGGIPGVGSKWGFMNVCILLLLFFAFEILLFKKKKWF
ncbi:MAG TPA: zinc transporter ZntB [Coxiellaceae bacterium]|nr:zinc transporter ZntB [Coxiellaceae bacterium]